MNIIANSISILNGNNLVNINDIFFTKSEGLEGGADGAAGADGATGEAGATGAAGAAGAAGATRAA